MSHWDSGQHTVVSGMTTIYLTLETFNKRMGRDWEGKFKSDKNYILIMGKKFYMKELNCHLISDKIKKYKLSLISSGSITYTEKEFKRLKEKYDNVVLDVQTPTMDFNTYPQWVHDWKESVCVDKKKRIWAEARDTIQNDEHPYEVEWSQAYDYWCSDCHDKHSSHQPLLIKFYKTKKSALKAAKTIPKSIPEYIGKI
jgi:hypothetical protein